LAVSDWFTRRRQQREGSEAGPVHPTKALGRFLKALSRHANPTVLDLGPAVGANLTFLGQELGCKVVVEDVFKDVEQHAAEGTIDALAAEFDTRLSHEAESVDGIVCWDVFDYLDRPAAERLARQLIRVLRPGGAVLALFNTVTIPPATRPRYTRHVIVDVLHIEYRTYAGSRSKQRPLQNRDVQRLFEPLTIAENFLLTTNVREVVFRKPAAAPGATLAPAAG
jgi:SAM-dependent methyltransferase